jgi:2-methylcitrate dehydratase PrpD
MNTSQTARERSRNMIRSPEVCDPPGHPSRELTWDDIAAKFMDCAAQARIDPSKAQRVLSLLTRLETCTDMGAVVALLH